MTYTAKDKAGNETKQEATFAVTNFLRFEGVADRILPYDVDMTTAVALYGVKAFNNSSEITYSIQVTISEPLDNQYTVTYSITDNAGHAKTATAIFTKEK